MFLKIIILFPFFFSAFLFAQQTGISGKIIALNTQLGISNAHIQLEGSKFFTMSNKQGGFVLEGKLPLGEQIITISSKDYQAIRLPVVIIYPEALDMGVITLHVDLEKKESYFTIIELNNIPTVSDEELENNQILLQANRDAFLSSVAFNWGSSFFKIRGLGSEYSKVLLNGVEMNSFYNHRPNWSAWSGLNDLLRNQEYTAYSQSNKQTFGGLVGVNQLQFYADKYKKGSKVSLASTNRTYQGRLMVTHHSGKLHNGWSYSVSGSGALSKEGYVEGTSLEGYSLSGSIGKKINKKHKLNLTAIYTPSSKGRVSPNTQEVIDLKGRSYNAYWGLQNGRIRNSRIKKTSLPIYTLNHFWEWNKKIKIQNNIWYQNGSIRNSRLEFNGKELSQTSRSSSPIIVGGSRNPDPSYYQRLPSFFLQDVGEEDFEAAFKADRAFRKEGQLDWEEIYSRNQNSNATGAYALYDDVTADRIFGGNTLWDYQYSSHVSLEGKVGYRKLISENYAQIKDLLGAQAYLDVEGFSKGVKAQNNVQNPNRIVGEGDRFRYNYEIEAQSINGFVQSNISISQWEMYTALSVENRKYQRNGKYENGNYLGNASLGRSRQLTLNSFGLKLGVTRQLNNKYYLSSNLNLLSTPPSIQQSFSNPRQNNQIVIGLENQQWLSSDINLNYQYGKISARLSAYYIKRKKLTDVSFFFTENIASLGRTDSSAFVQEITTGIQTLNKGIEFGAEIEATNTLTINASMALGKHIYTNNPDLYITSDSFDAPLFLGNSKLKNYRLANGPQSAYGLGLSYRDPSYWWFSTQLNYFSNSYLDISPFSRTQNFTTDVDGQTLVGFEESRARELLEQEQLTSYFLWNAIGGKSWRIKHNNYLGFTFGVQNILDQFFKTGGFEQSRNSNYNSLNTDQNRELPLFGNKYWLGNGTTYYINTYWRF